VVAQSQALLQGSVGGAKGNGAIAGVGHGGGVSAGEALVIMGSSAKAVVVEAVVTRAAIATVKAAYRGNRPILASRSNRLIDLSFLDCANGQAPAAQYGFATFPCQALTGREKWTPDKDERKMTCVAMLPHSVGPTHRASSTELVPDFDDLSAWVSFHRSPGELKHRGQAFAIHNTCTHASIYLALMGLERSQEASGAANRGGGTHPATEISM
jgi:hypothetical protein